jgi:branched-chain amino acid transport system permease protein
MQLFAAVFQGVLVGGLYATVGLGLSLIFGVLRIVNLAHGEFVVGAAFLSFFVTTTLGLDPLVTLPLVMVVMAIGGWLLQRCLLGHVARRGTDGPLVATFGLSLVAQAALTGAFTANARSIPAGYATSGLAVFGTRVQESYLIAFGISVVTCGLVHLLLRHTRWGSAVHASTEDPSAAALLGVDVKRLHALVFALAAALAGVGGVLVGVTVSFTPTSGITYLVLGFAVVVMGGIGNVAGSVVAAVILGVVQSLTAYSFGGGYRDLVAYVVFLAVLAFRPRGLLGSRLAT